MQLMIFSDELKKIIKEYVERESPGLKTNFIVIPGFKEPCEVDVSFTPSVKPPVDWLKREI